MNVGIIGFGRIGAEHAGWINAARGLRAVAAADATAARRELAKQRGLNVYESEQQLLNHNDVEAILIATPTAMHFQHAADALRAGKHVLVEKPMTLTLDEARQLVEIARSTKRVLSVFQNRRWDVDYLTVKSAIAAGTFGRIINVESRLGQWASCVGPAAREWHPTWRNEAAFGGGGLYDWGSHFVDQLWRLMLPAKPVRVFAQLRGNVWTEDCDDLARVNIDFDNGAVSLVEINTTTTRPLPRWHIDGTLGSAESPFSLEFDTKRWAQLTFAPAQGGAAREIPVASGGFSESQLWERFAAACRGDGEPAVPVRSVLPTVALLDAARESSRRGEDVSLDAELDWRE